MADCERCTRAGRCITEKGMRGSSRVCPMFVDGQPTEKLLACQFCGAPGKIVDRLNGEMFVATCENGINCVRSMPYANRADAVKIWNRRTKEINHPTEKCGDQE